MNIQEYLQLQAEQAVLKNLLSILPPSSVIERKSLESRKQQVEAALAAETFLLHGQVRRAEARFSQENLHEKDMELEGTFQGVLPKRRAFEFLVADIGEVISGRVGPAIVDARQINQLLGKSSKILVHSTRVGAGRPRYFLLTVTEPPPGPAGPP